MSEETSTVNATTLGDDDTVDINVSGVVSIVVFYIVILLVGIWAGWKQRKQSAEDGTQDDQETVIVAGRNIGLFVGILTMSATWVGGGFINGSAEAAYSSGLVWVQAPFGFALSLIISGTFFAKKMRDAHYVTMIDPFTQKYGKWGALQALPSAMSEIFWSAAILGALGSTLRVILGFKIVPSIISSAVIAVLYTLMGGLISVAYTDVFQIIFITFGLFLALPFALTNEHVSSIDFDTTDWRGSIKAHQVGVWIDTALLLLLGGIPWQCYYQRVLSSKTSKRAMILSYSACVIAIILAIPATLMGAVAKATDWKSTEFGHEPTGAEITNVLPLCLRYLTPEWVSFFGLGAVSAAVMSSTDSSMLSASSMLARNVYKTVFRPYASDKEILICLWILIIINASIATALAISYQSVYGLFVLCGDFVYVIVFPQLFLVLYFDKANTYGSVVSFFIGLLLRLLCGDEILHIPTVISFGTIPCNESDPDCSGPGAVPFRTIVMLISLAIHVVISWATYYIFTNGILSLQLDFLQCYHQSSSGLVVSRSSRFLNEDTSDVLDLDDLGNKGKFVPNHEISSIKSKPI